MTGISVQNGGNADISNATIYANTTGVDFIGSGHGSLSGNTFYNAAGIPPTNRVIDLDVESSAGTVTDLGGNAFYAPDFYILNASPTNIDATHDNFTGNTFTNFAPLTDATPAANLGTYYAIEDRISDHLDQPSAGYVKLKSGYDFLAHSSETATAGAMQRLVDASTSGDTAYVQAGTFVGSVSVNKSVTMEGAQAGNNAVTRSGNFTNGKAKPAVESIITPATVSPGSGALVHVLAGGGTLDGFVVDGNNPDLPTSGAGQINGAGPYIDIRNGIDTVDPINGGQAVNNLLIENNIVQNVDHDGIALINPSDGSAVTSGSTMTGNVVSNFLDYGILQAYNAYADITDNTVVMPDNAEAGVWVYDFTANGATAASQTVNVLHNTITAGHDDFGGIWANLDYAPTATLNITGNTVNAGTGVTGADGFTTGIYLTSLQNGFDAVLSGNTVGALGWPVRHRHRALELADFRPGVGFWRVRRELVGRHRSGQ